MSNQINPAKKSLTIKDLVTTGIFSAIFLVFTMIGGIFFAPNPVLTFYMPMGAALLCGPVYLLMIAKYMERLSDHAVNIRDLAVEMHEKKTGITKGGMEELNVYSRAVQDIVRETIQAFRTGENASGELKIIFRTQSQELLFRLAEFFELWTKMEKIYLKDYSAQTINYSFENGKFTRTFAMPRDRIYDNEETARAISDYIRMFDDIVKGYLTGAYMSFAEMENRYLQYLNGSVVI